MKRQLKLLCCFYWALNVFLSAVLFLPLSWMAPDVQEQIDREQIISKAIMEGYPKHLDSFYFNVATILIPLSAFLLWKFLFSRIENRRQPVFWAIAFLWMICLFGYFVQ